jgi:hypothetical protein
VYACDNGSCEIAVDNHAAVNVLYVDVAFELICPDKLFLHLFSSL